MGTVQQRPITIVGIHRRTTLVLTFVVELESSISKQRFRRSYVCILNAPPNMYFLAD